MPTLGFLKKKRTKDGKDSDSPTSPVKDTFSKTSTQSSTASGNTTADSAALAKKQSSEQPQQDYNLEKATHHDTPMNSSAGYAHLPQQPLLQTSPGQSQQNVSSINNLLNPADNTKSANGGATMPVSNPLRTTKGKYTLTDFQIQRTLGTGSFGRVHLVQSKHNQRFYAIKVLKKAQVVKMKQVEHTNDERKMLQKVKHPFLITLWGTFQDSKNLYMVMDFVEGGELFSLLRKSQVRTLASSQIVCNSILMMQPAVPQPCRQILRGRGHPCARLPPFDEYNISRFEA